MSNVQKKISHYNLETLASSLRLESIDVLETQRVDLESHWYRSEGPAELFFWVAKDRMIKHQLNLFGQVVEWNEYDGVKTGYINEERMGHTFDIKSMIEFDKTPEAEVTNMACEFIRKVHILNADTKSQIVGDYQSYFRWNRSKILRFIHKILFPGKK